MVRSFHNNATRLLCFFIRSIASYIFWYRARIFGTKSGRWEYIGSLKNSIRKNFSLKKCRFASLEHALILQTNIILADDANGPRLSSRIFSTNCIAV